MAEGVPTNNQRRQRAGPCCTWGGLDKARYIVPIASLVRVQCFRKGLYKAIEGPSTRPKVFSMITGSNCRRRRRLTIFEQRRDEIRCSSFIYKHTSRGSVVKTDNVFPHWRRAITKAHLSLRLRWTEHSLKFFKHINLLYKNSPIYKHGTLRIHIYRYCINKSSKVNNLASNMKKETLTWMYTPF